MAFWLSVPGTALVSVHWGCMNLREAGKISKLPKEFLGE